MTKAPDRLPAARRFPEGADFATGPAVGERVPDFVLPDQNGNEVRLSEVLPGGRTLLVFVRSFNW